MAEKITVDASKVFRIRAKGEVTCRVGIAHRRDYELLLRKGVVLAVDTGERVFHLVDPVGEIHFLRKECVRVLGPASPKVVVEATKNGFISKRV